MFSKAAKPEKTSDVSLSANTGERKAPKPASLISQDITLEGGIVGEGELHVDGVIRGDVRVGRLTLGDTGHIEGSVQAETVDIRGRIIGTVTAKQVRLFGTAYVDGDITHEQLSVESGAFFQGRSLKFQRPAPVALAAPEPEVQSA
ncbi:cell shape determination protein CcmA [Phenylobacterium sp. Root77]|uniref:bactofilin family protein n=1 Tax=unclassified Phenylobacterium TaxID=2640670 RepID=UPI0006F7538D|nr:MULTISPECIES: polymer-forming cytoskeletal protein [unclassified Phenylobacterium]KQW71467.1 cell shape determination protein CcmA [Phenylobacterium sp. Root1277]KQW94387.1 cell shape determination protein CcmA [Phenylobacterium sp. Root1290]KRC44081.1 cell shape determination protein CcmA [Phenylobacterium sp. Root77]